MDSPGKCDVKRISIGTLAESNVQLYSIDHFFCLKVQNALTLSAERRADSALRGIPAMQFVASVECRYDGVTEKEHQMGDTLEIVGFSVIGRFPCQYDCKDERTDLQRVEVERELHACKVSQCEE